MTSKQELILGYGTGPIRIRILRHWSRSKDSMRGFWILLIEPRWPIVRFRSDEHPDEFTYISPTQDHHTCDIVLEHYKKGLPITTGDCNGGIASIDLFCFARWLK